MDETKPEAEVWVRKPKKTTHNQLLIQLLIILEISSPLGIVGVVFSILNVFSIFFQVVLAAWACLLVFYVGGNIYVRMSEKKEEAAE